MYTINWIPKLKHFIKYFNLVHSFCLLLLLIIAFLSMFRLYKDYQNKKSKVLGKHLYFRFFLPKSIMI